MKIIKSQTNNYIKHFFITLLFVLPACSVPSAYVQPELAPVRIKRSSFVYFLPECEQYAKIPAKVLQEIPTAQEAELSGYRPAPCAKEVLDQRLKTEREIFGEIKASAETELRRSQLALQRKLSDLEARQDEIEQEAKNKQEELKDKQREIEEKQNELEDKQREIEDKEIYKN